MKVYIYCFDEYRNTINKTILPSPSPIEYDSTNQVVFSGCLSVRQ